jgi:hypothetical protein
VSTFHQAFEADLEVPTCAACAKVGLHNEVRHTLSLIHPEDKWEDMDLLWINGDILDLYIIECVFLMVYTFNTMRILSLVIVNVAGWEVPELN